MLFTLFLLLSSSAQADPVPVDNLLSFFSSTCPSEGAWTQAALGDAAALRTALDEMAKDEDCQALSAESTSANAITSSLTIINQQIANNASEVSVQSQEQAVLSAMAYTTDPSTIAEDQTLLTQLDAQSVATKAANRLSVQATAANQLVAATHSIVQQAVNNQKCVMKRPGILASLGSLVANVGAAVTAINPAIGLGASAVGTLISDLVNLGHQKEFTKGIRKLNDGSIKPEAISCVLESLSNDYCRAQDAVTSIDWAQAHRVRNNYPVSSPLYGLGLLNREVQNLNQWLGNVKVSRLAQNPADATRVQEFRNLEAAYLNSPDLFSGTINTFRSQLDGISDIGKRWPIIRSMVVALVNQLGAPQPYSGNNSVSNPLFLTKNRNEAEFFLVGIDASRLDKAQNQVPSFEQGFSPSDLFHQSSVQVLKTDLGDIQNQFDSWYADTKVLVDDQRAQVLQPDVLATLESAFSKTQDYDHGNGRNTVSPFQSLSVITEYLKDQLAENPGESESFYFLPDTLLRLERIRAQLQSLHAPKKLRNEKDYGNILAEIYTAANLEEGSSFLKNRIGDHINSALVRYLSDPANSKDTAPILAQTLASDRMTDILTQSNPRGDIGMAREDIVNSITIVLPTYATFVDTFQKEIKGVLNFLQGQEILYGGKTGETFLYKRAKICLLMTNLPKWPDDVPFDLCQGTSFTTLADGPRSPVLTADYMAKPVDVRSCGYYQLQRATLIHQAKLDFSSR
jgi:hypothetical protein